MDHLHETQQLFLQRYINSKGDLYGSLQSLGLEYFHFVDWRRDPDFDLSYRESSQNVALIIREENFNLGLRRVNELLINGNTQLTATVSHYQKKDDSTYIEEIRNKQTVKHLPIPVSVLKIAIGEGAIIKAINQLLAERVIPPETAKKLMNAADRISTEMIKAFQGDGESNEITDKKVIALIKSVVLGD